MRSNETGGVMAPMFAHYIIQKGPMNVVVESARLESSLCSFEIRLLLDLSEENARELIRTGQTTVKNMIGGKQELVTMKGCNCQDMYSHQRGDAHQFRIEGLTDKQRSKMMEKAPEGQQISSDTRVSGPPEVREDDGGFLLKRLRGRHTRRLVFGIILTSLGALITLSAIGTFFAPPAPNNTAEEQKTSALIMASVLGVPLLGIGVLLLLSARSVGRKLLTERIGKTENPTGKTGARAKSVSKAKLDKLKAQRDFEGLVQAHALDQLVDLLQNEERPIRVRAATALGMMGDIGAVPQLILAAMLDSHLREYVLAALDRLKWKPGDDSLGGAFTLLKLSQWDSLGISVGEKIARAGQIPIVPLIAALSDNHIPRKWRIEAANVVSTIGDERAVVPLVEALREANAAGERQGGTSLRTAAILCLIRLKKAAVGPVDDLLAMAIHQQNEELQGDCLTILSNIAKKTEEVPEKQGPPSV